MTRPTAHPDVIAHRRTTRRRTPLLLVMVVAIASTAVFSTAAKATVPGRNGLIAFRADVGSGSQIYTIRPNAEGLRQLTHLPGDALQPHWSANSRLITFEFDPAQPTHNDFCHVAYMHAGGSETVILPEANGDVCEATPSFSPTKARIYYEGFDGTRDAIFSMNPRGRDRQRVTACRGNGVTDPEPSPNGEMLAFTCFDPSGGAALFDCRIDGSHLRQLTRYSLGVGNKEDWAPSGDRIMFISVHDEGDADAQVNTATIRPDGTGLKWLTHYPAGGTLAYGNTYSPDGRWILLRLERHGRYALYKIHPNGRGLRDVTAFSSFRPRGMAWGSHR